MGDPTCTDGLDNDCDTLIDAAERMARLTAQMLAYSGRGRFIVEQVDISNQVRQIINLIRASVPKGVELRLSLREQIDSRAETAGRAAGAFREHRDDSRIPRREAEDARASVVRGPSPRMAVST